MKKTINFDELAPIIKRDQIDRIEITGENIEIVIISNVGKEWESVKYCPEVDLMDKGGWS